VNAPSSSSFVGKARLCCGAAAGEIIDMGMGVLPAAD
jgi:hypothetical protein